jgi:hypothetical protein
LAKFPRSSGAFTKMGELRAKLPQPVGAHEQEWGEESDEESIEGSDEGDKGNGRRREGPDDEDHDHGINTEGGRPSSELPSSTTERPFGDEAKRTCTSSDLATHLIDIIYTWKRKLGEPRGIKRDPKRIPSVDLRLVPACPGALLALSI